MMYCLLSIPPLVAMIAFMISLKYSKNKSAMIVAAAFTMVISMFALEKLSTFGAFSFIAIAFVLSYFVISLFAYLKEEKKECEPE